MPFLRYFSEKSIRNFFNQDLASCSVKTRTRHLVHENNPLLRNKLKLKTHLQSLLHLIYHRTVHHYCIIYCCPELNRNKCISLYFLLKDSWLDVIRKEKSINLIFMISIFNIICTNIQYLWQEVPSEKQKEAT